MSHRVTGSFEYYHEEERRMGHRFCLLTNSFGRFHTTCKTFIDMRTTRGQRCSRGLVALILLASVKLVHSGMKHVHRSRLPFFKIVQRNNPALATDGYTTYRRQHLLSFRGGDTVTEPYSEFLELAYGWCINLGAPSALVAGVVVATLHENIHQGDLVVSKHDKFSTQLAKKLTHLLLLSAFALETMSIFVTTVTATMLLSRGTDAIPTLTSSSAPLHFLWENYEFEYLTARITFLQGLLNWLAALGMNHIIPSREPTSKSVQAFNKFVAFSLFTVIVLMVSFYNDHMTFYPNYLVMFSRWAFLTIHGYFGGRRTILSTPRPLAFVLMPLLVVSLYWGYRALVSYEEDNEHTQVAMRGRRRRFMPFG